MKRGFGGLVLVACCGALLASGCTKQAELKKDEGVAPVAQAPAAKQEAPAVVKPAEQAPAAQAVEQKQVVAETKESAVQQISREEASLQKELATIYFGFDSPKLTDEARGTLTKDAEVLKKFGKGKIRIEGNCDERGSDDYNLALGEKRAKEAAKYLTNMGIPEARLTVISYGKEKPAAQGHDEASWAKNRRDDFVVIP